MMTRMLLNAIATMKMGIETKLPYQWNLHSYFSMTNQPKTHALNHNHMSSVFNDDGNKSMPSCNEKNASRPYSNASGYSEEGLYVAMAVDFPREEL